jgi:hypothetical protein
MYTIQNKAWFDKAVVLEWVKQILMPYVVTAPIGIIPIHFLDSFKVHQLGTVANAINNLGVKIKFIPAGCTGFVQPSDCGINKPYKANMTKVYTQFMMGQDSNEPICAAKREDMSGWIIEAVGGITKETV